MLPAHITLDLTQFGEWLYRERTRQHLRQSDLSKKSKVNHVMISKYENGSNPRLSIFMRILDALGYDVVIELKRKDQR